VRTAIGSIGLALVVAQTLGAAALTPSPGGAALRSRAATPAILAVGAHGATAALADGRARVELPWLLPGDTEAVVAPGGHRIAFSSARDGSAEIYIADTTTGQVRRLTDNANAEDVQPAWSPDGSSIVWASGPPGSHDLFAMDRDGGRKHRLTAGPGNDVDPAWSPDGARIAFASNREGHYGLWLVGSSGGTPELFTTSGRARAPAWSPGGDRLAYTGIVGPDSDVWVVTLDGLTQRRLTAAPAYDGRPDWSPDGHRLAYVSERGGVRRIWLMRADGTHQRVLPHSQPADDTPDWAMLDAAVAPSASALLPDLDQRAPSGLVVIPRGNGYALGFTSAVDNIGLGAIHIRGTRISAARTMRADQIVHRRGGGVDEVVRGIGRLAYEPHPPHFHWHLQPYERYELRRAADFAFVARDRKSGFCLLDRWGHARPHPGIVPRPPRFVGDCAAGNPLARSVEEGSSIGYTDRYPAFFHGQDIDITGLASGLYVLVHRVNPDGKIRELRYSNDAASALIRLRRKSGTTAPTVTVLRRCEGSERCPSRPR
jgi:WD40-like Beta Propeller Repeat/Lysyl oxidase